jgi:hypothetical protein
MGLFKRIKETVAVATGRQAPDLSALTPEQRERYERTMADQQRRLDEAEAEWQQLDEAEAARRAELVIADHRPPPPTAAERRAMAESPDAGAALAAAGQQVRETWQALSPKVLARQLAGGVYGEVFGRQLSDGRTAAERERLAVEEWEARAAARRPYRSPDPPPVAVSRVATRGRTQLDEVRAWLAATGLAARPELVWSVHRVPDRISPNLTANSEAARVVEWEVVHQPVALPPAPAPVEVTSFHRGGRWIARRLGEPVPLDEDVGAWFLEWADLAPSGCFGITRLLTMRSYGGGAEQSGELCAVVSGVAVLHAPSARAVEVRRRMEAEQPVVRAPGPGRLRVDRLDWGAVGERVHPLVNGTPSVPSPEPHLPSSPQELLLAYLEVVGIDSADCAGASVVTDDRTIANAFALGPSLPVADGTPRRRSHGAQEVVVVYRDTPEYEAGRARWARYQSEVLRARLTHATDRRATLDLPTRADNVIGVVSNMVEAVVSPIDWLDRVEGSGEPPFVAFPYCWPPVT